MLRPDWSDGLGPWNPDDDDPSPDDWARGERSWEPGEAPADIPPVSHEERMSMLRRAFDPVSLLPLGAVQQEATSESEEEGATGTEAARGWARAIRESRRAGVLGEAAARWMIYAIVSARFDTVTDLEYEMLWDRWHDLRVAHGFPLGEAFREWADYPAEAREVDARIDRRYVERFRELLEELGEFELAGAVGDDAAAFEDYCRWEPPPELTAKDDRRSDWWCAGRDRWLSPDAPVRHAAFVDALASARATDPAVGAPIAAVLAALRMHDAMMASNNDDPAVRAAVAALPAGHPVRAPLLAFVNGIAAYDEVAHEYDSERHSALVAPLSAIAGYFEAEGERSLAAHLYWMIERHGARWDVAERALAARKRLTAQG